MQDEGSKASVISAGRLGYLSGAPRVSTRDYAEASGPRSHILGVISAFETLGWNVHRFIVGDKMPDGIVNSERLLTRSSARALFADLARLALGNINGRRAWKELGSRVDFVYERFAAFQALGLEFKRRGIPWILETNGLFYREANAERNSMCLTAWARRLEISAYENCDLLICVSNSLKNLILQDCRIAESKILVLPNGVDTSFFDARAHSAKRFFPGLTIGFVGTLARWQGLDLMLDSLSDLAKSGTIVSLVIVGDGQMLEALQRQAQTLGLERQVKFAGRIPRSGVPSYIAGFDIGFSAQKVLETGATYHSPLKLYEYMSMGKPVLASTFEDASRVVKQQETGFLFRPGDIEDLKRAILTAVSCRERLLQMGLRARNAVIQEHSWIQRVRQIVNCMEKTTQFANNLEIPVSAGA